MKTWYAVYTKKDCEKNVISQLKRKKIKFFYPLNYVLLNGKYCTKPLFLSYVFIYITEAELKCINEIKDIINPVYWKDQPVSFAEQEMERIISFLKSHIAIEVKRIDVVMKPVQNEVYVVENTQIQINDPALYQDALTIPMLGVLLKSDRIPAPAFQLRKNQFLHKFLFRLGFSNQL